MKRLNFETKELIVQLAGNCFWYWNSFYSFLASCSVQKQSYLKYPKDSFKKYDVMRNILTDLDDSNKSDIINEIISGFFKLSKPVDTDVHNPEKAKMLLKEFKQHVGTDPIQREIEKMQSEKSKEAYKNIIYSKQKKSGNISILNENFASVITDNSITPQNKGYALEKLFFEILSLEEFEHEPPYREGIEQIDGRFKFEKFDYLVEIKFVSELVKQDMLAIFDNKIKSKAQSTRGFFLALNGFDIEHLKNFKGNSPRLVLMDGPELSDILEGRKSFYDLFRRKVEKLVHIGEIYYKSTI